MTDKPPPKNKVFSRIPIRLFSESTPEVETIQHVDKIENNDRPLISTKYCIFGSLDSHYVTPLALLFSDVFVSFLCFVGQ